MKFGVRQCANIVFRAKQETKIGTKTFHIGQPVLYIDTATTSSLEQATSTNYAQGGRGNTRLIAWQGDKTLTFTVTDALISPVSLSMLSGAGLVKEENKKVHVHAMTANTMTVSDVSGTKTGKIDLTNFLLSYGELSTTSTGDDGKVIVDIGTDAPLFIMKTEDDGSIDGDIITGTVAYTVNLKSGSQTEVESAVLEITSPKINDVAVSESMNVLVDFYVIKPSASVSEIQITPQDFAGYYYVEADTLFRTQSTGKDMPANLTFPNVKVQSGFTITMAGTGDPSTFNFTMDAFPGYTYFDKTKQVLCVIQVVEDSATASAVQHTVMPKNSVVEHSDPLTNDSYVSG